MTTLLALSFGARFEAASVIDANAAAFVSVAPLPFLSFSLSLSLSFSFSFSFLLFLDDLFCAARRASSSGVDVGCGAGTYVCQLLVGILDSLLVSSTGFGSVTLRLSMNDL